MEKEVEIDVKEEKKDYSSFNNYSKKRVTLVGYLIGVKDNSMFKAPFNQIYLQKIKDIKEIKIIRALCIIRLNFLFEYDKIFKKKKSEGPFVQFENMSEHIDVASLKYLKSVGLEPLRTGVDMSVFTKHIACINQLIEEQIEKVHNFFPAWINWQYIKDLFIMPNCSAGVNGNNYKNKKNGEAINQKIHQIRKWFYENMDFYPYKTYINWNQKKIQADVGNILFNDSKFLKLLYDSHYDSFKGDEYVIDAKDDVKNGIYGFLEEANNIVVFVDCENVDPYRLAATFKNLEEEKVRKIRKVVLYDDVNTTNAWDILSENLHLTVEHVEVNRIKNDKSLVDHALAIGVTRSLYEEQIDSAVIASSDSDFWGLIEYLPKLRFFVMNEREITSKNFIDGLDAKGVPHCFMDEFAQDAIQPYKNAVLKKNFQKIIDEFNMTGNLEFLSVEDMLTEIFRRSSIPGHYKQIENEKIDFYNKYIKKLRLVIDDWSGKRRIKLVID